MQLNAPVVSQDSPPGCAVTVYRVMGEPPVEGAFHVTVTSSSPGVPATPVGAEGAVTGVVTKRPMLAELVPAALVACTKTKYD